MRKLTLKISNLDNVTNLTREREVAQSYWEGLLVETKLHFMCVYFRTNVSYESVTVLCMKKLRFKKCMLTCSSHRPKKQRSQNSKSPQSGSHSACSVFFPLAWERRVKHQFSALFPIWHYTRHSFSWRTSLRKIDISPYNTVQEWESLQSPMCLPKRCLRQFYGNHK